MQRNHHDGLTTQQHQRRRLLTHACLLCAGGLASSGVLGQALTNTGITTPYPVRHVRPDHSTEEGGLWALMDREEARLMRSQFRIREGGLQSYLNGLVCNLTANHCADVRVYPVRTPYFNASMAPNGMMQVWSGLLLRVESEAQLAAVLGHEFGHYSAKHTLELFKDAKNKSAFATFASLFGGVGGIVSLITVGSFFSFAREQETAADKIGVQVMLEHGYDPTQAATIWSSLSEEVKAGRNTDALRGGMFATHPAMQDRHDALLALAAGRTGKANQNEFIQATAPYRLDWVQDEIKRGQHEESVVLFSRLIKAMPQQAEHLFGRGEVYRLRAGAQDAPLALADLTAAAQAPRPIAQAWRSLGFMYRTAGNKASAIKAFEYYIQQFPQAPDSALVQSYISELKV